LLDEVETRHQEADPLATLDEFFHEDESAGEAGLTAASRNFYMILVMPAASASSIWAMPAI
jgi:hypothetical protein